VADDADFANELIDRVNEAGVAEIRSMSKRRTLLPTGQCHYCAEVTTNRAQLFCDSTCAQDYEAEQAFLNARSAI
jgi:hypothetical protein